MMEPPRLVAVAQPQREPVAVHTPPLENGNEWIRLLSLLPKEDGEDELSVAQAG